MWDKRKWEELSEQQKLECKKMVLSSMFFPSIGKRAVWGWFIGPGGGGNGIIFTTHDEAYDISISYTNRMKDETHINIPSIEDLAKILSDSYQDEMNRDDN